MMLVGVPPQRALLVHYTFSVLITEMYFVHRITFAFLSPFPKIQRNKIFRGDTGQCVAHLEEKVNFLVCIRLQVGLQAGHTFIFCFINRHLCPSRVNPDKFPVKFQLIRKCLSWLDCIIYCPALCAGCHSSCQKE